MIAARLPQASFDEAADAQEQLERLGIATIASAYFQVGPYRYTNIADARAQAVRDRADPKTAGPKA
jgi:hypothetical protein